MRRWGNLTVKTIDRRFREGMTKMKLLLMAFEPVGSLRLDPSRQVAEQLSEKLLRDGVQAEAVLIPGSFARCGEEARRQIGRISPQVVMALAQRGSCEGIAFERRARNLIDAEIPDREGVQPKKTLIVQGGRAIYETALPIEQMAEAVRQKEIPAGISDDAGTFVCNTLYYHLLRAAEAGNFGMLFVHLPYLPGQNLRHPQAGLAFEDMVQGLEAAIGVLTQPASASRKAEKAP